MKSVPRTASPTTIPVPVGHSFDGTSAVGALFTETASGRLHTHFCTASVVDSPHNDVLITAAHCVHGGEGGGYQSDMVFVPGYQDGQAPYGVWQPKAVVVDQRWVQSSDPDVDVAFVVMQPQGGKEIGDVLGGNRLAVNQAGRLPVRVTGYPNDSDAPITCSSHTSLEAPTQRRFTCGGYSSGTSGSPWVAGLDPVTRAGQVIGVIGGYQEGGDTPDVSYSSYFSTDVENLYQQALAQG
jgi:V8-like Glu-specific endopeptidase